MKLFSNLGINVPEDFKAPLTELKDELQRLHGNLEDLGAKNSVISLVAILVELNDILINIKREND